MDEKMRILKMVEEGTVTADEAYQLMEAMGVDREIMTAPIKDYDKRLLHIQVESMKGDNVNIQLPVSAVKKITRATGKLPIPEKALHESISTSSWRQSGNVSTQKSKAIW